MFPSKIGFHSSILVPKITSTLVAANFAFGNYGTIGYVLANNINKRERFFVTSTNEIISIKVEITSTSANPFSGFVQGTDASANPIEIKINNAEYMHIFVQSVSVGSGTLSVRSGSSTGVVLASVVYTFTGGEMEEE
jgi:hypothetical protein